jgi:hypothetical protein
MLAFEDPDLKRCVVNLTRAEALASISGTSDTDRWAGTRILLSKGTTRFQGKPVNCIVISAPQPARKGGKATRDDIDDAMPSADDSAS